MYLQPCHAAVCLLGNAHNVQPVLCYLSCRYDTNKLEPGKAHYPSFSLRSGGIGVARSPILCCVLCCAVLCSVGLHNSTAANLPVDDRVADHDRGGEAHVVVSTHHQRRSCWTGA